MGKDASTAQVTHTSRQAKPEFYLNGNLLQPGALHSHPAAGKPCPACGMALLEYDGWLNLVCPVCGFSEGGGFT